MRSSDRIGIEITPDEIRGAHVSVVDGVPVLRGVARETLYVSPTLPDGNLDPEILLPALEQLRSKMCAKVQHAVVGLPRTRIIERVTEVPAALVEDSALYRNSPTVLELAGHHSTVADFYLMPDPVEPPTHPSEGDNRQVLIAGADEDSLKTVLSCVERAGLTCAAIEPSGMALFRLLSSVDAEERAVVYIVVTAGVTDLFISEFGALQLCRQFDCAVSDLENACRFAARKWALEGDSFGPMDEDDDDAITNDRISDLGTSLKRTIDYYLREFPSVVPYVQARMVVDSQLGISIRARLTKHLPIKPSLVDLPDRLQVPDPVRLVVGGAGCVDRYAPSIGLALRGLPGFMDGPNLDLTPFVPKPISRRAVPNRLAASLTVSSIIVLIAICWHVVLGQSTSRAESRLELLRAKLGTQESAYQAAMAALASEQTRKRVIAKNRPAYRILDELLSTRIPRGVALSSVEVDPEGGVYLVGQADAISLVPDLTDRLSAKPRLKDTRIVGVNSVPRSTPDRVSFELFIESSRSTTPLPTTPDELIASGRVRPNTGQSRRFEYDDEDEEDHEFHHSAPTQVAVNGAGSGAARVDGSTVAGGARRP